MLMMECSSLGHVCQRLVCCNCPNIFPTSHRIGSLTCFSPTYRWVNFNLVSGARSPRVRPRPPPLSDAAITMQPNRRHELGKRRGSRVVQGSAASAVLTSRCNRACPNVSHLAWTKNGDKKGWSPSCQRGCEEEDRERHRLLVLAASEMGGKVCGLFAACSLLSVSAWFLCGRRIYFLGTKIDCTYEASPRRLFDANLLLAAGLLVSFLVVSGLTFCLLLLVAR